jgi:Cellulase (glycosyl hydrolase family 5)
MPPPIHRVLTLLAALLLATHTLAAAPPRIELSPDGHSFRLAGSDKPFIPWGFNYDRDHKFRLIEEYWESEWSTIEEDFREMKSLGANVIRIHLQFGRFMDSPEKPNAANLARLEKLVRLSEQTGLYLDLTGLGCYRKKDVPAWYDALSEQDRWTAQSRFWEVISRTCADRPGVFCYDLINEPLVPGDDKPINQWVHPVALANLHYVQYIARDLAGRPRADVAQQWTRQMVQAIRKHDEHRLITVGLITIDLGKPEEASGFVPGRIAPELDFLAIHVYPQTGKLDAALDVLRRCKSAGKPLIVEEIFPLRCDIPTLRTFIERARKDRLADGLLGFYWGQPPAELKISKSIGDQMTRSWLELFQAMTPRRTGRLP